MIRQLITEFPDHLRKALKIGSEANLKPVEKDLRNVLITGLGGSGIGGRIASQLVAAECPLPIGVNNTYHIPGYVNEHTLVIVSSYSGNTEETLFAMEAALSAGAEVACVTAGGEVKAKAEESGLNHIVIPEGMPPRAAFGFSFPQLFFLLKNYGLINQSYIDEIDTAIDLLEENQMDMEAGAESLALELIDKFPIIYSDVNFEGVATRLRQQINENSKMLCWHHVFPEMNHNELVGWSKDYENVAVLVFRNPSDFERTQKRMDITIELMTHCTENIYEIRSEGETDVERSLFLIHLGDWISLLLAEKQGVDPFAIESINHLKSELAKI